MSEECENKSLIQSYVYFEDKCFYVSTINRRSSAINNPCMFSETLVWACDRKTNERGALIGQEAGIKDSIKTHIKVCELILKTGKCEEEENE